MLSYQYRAERIADRIANRRSSVCSVKGCGSDAVGLHPYCNRHRIRMRVYGTPDRRIPDANRVRLLMRLARQLLDKLDDKKLDELTAEIDAVCRAMGRRPSKGHATVVGPPITRQVYVNAITRRPGFSPIDLIAKATVAVAIEQSGFYAFPNRVAYEAFIGRMMIGRSTGRNISSNDARWVARKLFPLISSLAKALASSVAAQFDRMLQAGDTRAAKLWCHLVDCRDKPLANNRPWFRIGAVGPASFAVLHSGATQRR